MREISWIEWNSLIHKCPGKHITRPLDILLNIQILSLAVILCVQTSVSVSTTIIMMDVDAIIPYPCTI